MKARANCRKPVAGMVAGLIGLASTAAWCEPSTALPPDLARASADYDHAQVAGDREALERLLADDYRLVNSAGQVESKPQFIAESVDPAFRLEPFKVESPIQTVWTNGAVLAGDVHLSGSDHGKPFAAHMRFADIWAKRDGRWRVVFTEVTPYPHPPAG